MMSKSKSPLITIVIPTFNRESLILDTLATIFAQTYQNYEILIVDNCSTDQTESILQPYIANEQVRFIKHDQNYERARSRNTGMENARGDFLTFLDSDDFMYSTCLEDAVNYIESNPEAKCFHNLYELVNADKDVIYRYDFQPLTDRIKAIASGNFMSCIGNFIHRDIYSSYRFDTFKDLTGAEDWDFWLRVLADHNVGRLEKVNSGIQHHANRSMNGQNIADLESGYLYFFEKFRNHAHLSKVYSEYLDRIESSSYLYLATLSNMAGLFSESSRFIRSAVRAEHNVVLSRRFASLFVRTAFRWQIR